MRNLYSTFGISVLLAVTVAVALVITLSGLIVHPRTSIYHEHTTNEQQRQLSRLSAELASLRRFVKHEQNDTSTSLEDSHRGNQNEFRKSDLARWDGSVEAEVRVANRVQSDIEEKFGLSLQGEMIIRLTEEVKRLRVKLFKTHGILQSQSKAGKLVAAAEHVDMIQHREQRVVDSRTFKAIRTTDTPRKTPTCVNNPPLHFEISGELVKECTAKPASGSNGSEIPKTAYVLSLHGETERTRGMTSFLNMHGIHLEVFDSTNGRTKYQEDYETISIGSTNVTVFTSKVLGTKVLQGDPGFLTAGERGYLDTMRRLFSRLINENESNPVLVLDDDVLFDCNLADRLQDVLNIPRCGVAAMRGSSMSGALLLGAAIWIDGTYPQQGAYAGGWKVTDAELAALPRTSRKCHNVHSKTFGSFAVIYHPAVFPLAVEWIDHANAPFDHIYPYLVRKQHHIVRVAYPPVAIQDVQHESQIDPERGHQNNMSHRANLHRWHPLSRFCDPATHLPFTL